MRFFNEFGRGDIRISENPIFQSTKEITERHISMVNQGFERDKLASVLSPEQLESFFSSAFYRSIEPFITPFEYTHLFKHAVPSDVDARIILGAIRNPERWVSDIKYDKETHSIFYKGESKNAIEIADRLFSDDTDRLPQEVINESRQHIAYSQFLPTLDLIDPKFSQPEFLLHFFHEIDLFPYNMLNGTGQYYRFPVVWEPKALSVIFIEKLANDLAQLGLDEKDCFAWAMALDYTDFRKSDYGYKEMLIAASRGQRPHDYVKMSTRQLKNFESLYNAWTSGIDEALWDELVAGEAALKSR